MCMFPIIHNIIIIIIIIIIIMYICVSILGWCNPRISHC